MSIKSSLLIKNFQIPVSLGWTENERSQKQSISIDIALQFPEPPMACQSDELSETTCYEAIAQKITDFVHDKSFRLVEYLAGELYMLVKKSVAANVAVKIDITKHPCIANLN